MVAMTHQKQSVAEMPKSHKVWPAPLKNVNKLWGDGTETGEESLPVILGPRELLKEVQMFSQGGKRKERKKK